MAQTPSALRPHPELDVVLANRISIPFLRIQERKWLLGGVDVLLAAAWLIAGYELWRAVVNPASDNMGQMPWAWIVGGAGVWLVISWLAGAYELANADRFGSAARTTLTVAIVSLPLAFGSYYIFLKTYPRPALALVVVGLPVSVVVWRALYAAVLSRPTGATRLLVIGDNALCNALTEATVGRESYFRVLGFVAASPTSEPQYLGATESLEQIVGRYQPHRIVIAPRQTLSEGLVAMLCRCVERGIDVAEFNAAYEEIAGKVAVEHADDYWLAALPTAPSVSSIEEVASRLIDVAGAVIGLAVTATLGPFIAVAMTLESRGPIIYRQQRLGRAGHPFTVYKFRSMRTDAEEGGARWAGQHDARVTRVGRLLRRTHLDELPQFWNVLRGEMSLVGPRPERPEFTDDLSRVIPFYRLRLAVRPGLTGLKQIRVGYAASPEEHLEVLRHDLYYIKHRSLALNLLIIARTLGSVFGMDGR